MSKISTHLLTLFVAVLLKSLQVFSQDTSNEIVPFDPTVSAGCQGSYFTVIVTTKEPFGGIVHTKDKDKDYRTKECSVIGDSKSTSVTLKLNKLAQQDDPDFCGIVSKKNDNAKVTIAVRMHKTLELADDKYFTVQCDKPGFKNARQETSKVSLKFLEDDKRVTEVYHGRQYTLRADSSKPDGVYSIRVINCFAFGSSNNSEVPLINSDGCPVSPIITKFAYDKNKGYADATIFSMFKYPDSRRLVIQCDIMTCTDGCEDKACPSVSSLQPQGRTTSKGLESDGNLMISTSVYVLEPGEESPSALPLTDCSIHKWSWLLGLCIAFGVLFVIMLIINIFLCSALTCTCTRQEIIEKEPSVIEDYDPYKGGWGTGSQYGSRYSLHGKPGYTSGGSTLNSTTRSMSTNSDHYAIVHSHPGSRYSTHGSTKGGGPGSTLSNGQYNHAYNGRL